MLDSQALETPRKKTRRTFLSRKLSWKLTVGSIPRVDRVCKTESAWLMSGGKRR